MKKKHWKKNLKKKIGKKYLLQRNKSNNTETTNLENEFLRMADLRRREKF